MGYTLYVRDKIVPMIIETDVLDPPSMLGAVYEFGVLPPGIQYAEFDVDMGKLITPERPAPPSWHKEDTLNPGVPPVYPASFGRLIWQHPTPDYYGENASLRTELWEDSVGTATWEEIKATFPDLPGLMETAARKWGDDLSKTITAPYLENEQKTWPYQRAEAHAWVADNSVATPYCDNLAAVRRIPRGLMLQKIHENVLLFEQASTTIFGRQQAMIDLINYAASLDDVFAVAAALGITLLEVKA